MQVDGISLGKVEGVALSLMWHHIEDMIKRHPRGILDIATIEEVMDAIKHRQLDVWAAGNNGTLELVVLTQVSMFNLKKTLFIVWAGGKNLKVLGAALLEMAEKWCAVHNIKEISAAGPTQLGRMLAKFGFSCPRHEYVKSVGFTYLPEQSKYVRLN